MIWSSELGGCWLCRGRRDRSGDQSRDCTGAPTLRGVAPTPRARRFKSFPSGQRLLGAGVDRRIERRPLHLRCLQRTQRSGPIGPNGKELRFVGYFYEPRAQDHEAMEGAGLQVGVAGAPGIYLLEEWSESGAIGALSGGMSRSSLAWASRIDAYSGLASGATNGATCPTDFSRFQLSRPRLTTRRSRV